MLISQLSFLVSILVVDKWGEPDFIGLSLLFLVLAVSGASELSIRSYARLGSGISIAGTNLSVTFGERDSGWRIRRSLRCCCFKVPFSLLLLVPRSSLQA